MMTQTRDYSTQQNLAEETVYPSVVNLRRSARRTCHKDRLDPHATVKRRPTFRSAKNSTSRVGKAYSNIRPFQNYLRNETKRHNVRFQNMWWRTRRTRRIMDIAAIVMMKAGKVTPVIFQAPSFHPPPPPLPVHASPPPPQQGAFIALAMIFIYFADKVMSSAYVERFLKWLAAYIRKGADPDSRLEKAYRAAQAFMPSSIEMGKTKQKQKPRDPAGLWPRAFKFRKEEDPSVSDSAKESFGNWKDHFDRNGYELREDGEKPPPIPIPGDRPAPPIKPAVIEFCDIGSAGFDTATGDEYFATPPDDESSVSHRSADLEVRTARTYASEKIETPSVTVKDDKSSKTVPTVSSFASGIDSFYFQKPPPAAKLIAMADKEAEQENLRYSQLKFSMLWMAYYLSYLVRDTLYYFVSIEYVKSLPFRLSLHFVLEAIDAIFEYPSEVIVCGVQLKLILRTMSLILFTIPSRKVFSVKFTIREKCAERAFEEEVRKAFPNDVLKENDFSAAPDDEVSCDSTISSFESRIIEFGEVEVVKDSSAWTAAFDLLGENGGARLVGTFLSRCFTAPSYKDSKALCILHHFTNFSTLFTDLKAVYGDAIPELLKMLSVEIKKACGSFFVAESGEISDDAESNTWLDVFSMDFEKIGKFQDSPVGTVLASGLALICTLPVLLSKCFSATSYVRQWELLCVAFRTGGASVSTIVRQVLQVKKTTMEVEGSWFSRDVFEKLLCGNSFYTEFSECRETYRKLSLGIINMNPVEAQKFFDRLARLEIAAGKRVESEYGGIYDVRMKEDCTELYLSMSSWMFRNQSKIVPFGFSLDGKPNTGKSTFAYEIFPLLHEWRGIRDLMSIAPINLATKTDEVSSNRTTLVFLDDMGNAKGPARTAGKSLLNFLLEMVNNTYRAIEKADLPEKGRHFYRNIFYCLCDNDATRGVEEDLRAHLAGLRRTGVSAEVVVRPEFQNESGGLDLSKPGADAPFGGALLFRPYTWIKIGNAPPTQKNVFSGEGFIDNFSYLEYLRSEMEQHFARQEALMTSREESLKLPICGKCKLLPEKFCACEKPGCVAEMGVSDTLSFLKNKGASIYDVIAVRLRLMSCGLTARSSLCFIVLEENILESIAFCFLAYLVRSVFYGYLTFELASLVFVLSFALVLVCRKIRASWRRFRYHTIPELVDVHTASIRSWGTTAGYVFAALTVLITVPSALRTIVSLFPDRYEAQTAPVVGKKEEDAAVTVSIAAVEPPKATKAPDPIWAPVKRTPIEADLRTRTIAEKDLIDILQRNSEKVTIREILPMNSTEDPIEQPVHILYLNSDIAVTVAHAFLMRGKVAPVWMLRENKKPVVIESHRMFIAPGCDLMFLYMREKSVESKKDLINYLPENLTEKMFIVKMVKNQSGSWETEKIQATLQDIKYDLKNVHGLVLGTQKGYSAFGRSLETASGQCGLPYLGDTVHKIVAGIHVAGNKSVNSLIQPILRSQYNEALSSFVASGFGLPLYIAPYSIKAGTLTAECGPDPKHPVNFLPEGRDVEIFGWRAHNYTPRSELEVNPYLDQAIEHLGVRLKKGKPRMRVREIGGKVLESVTRDVPLGDADLACAAAKIIKEQITDVALANYTPQEYQTRPLTIAEVVNGIPGCVPSMILSKSSGIGGKKKDYVTGEIGERELVPEMVEDIENILHILKEGGNPWLPATACVKDEARAPGKLPRLFYNPVMQQYVILCMYLRIPLDFISANPVLFGTAIGLDPVGEEWQKVVEEFAGSEFGDNCFDLDYEAFDTSQCALLRDLASKVFIDIAEALWTDKEEVEMLRKILAWCNNTPVDMLGPVMKMLRLLISGMLYTAAGNGLLTAHVIIADLVRFFREHKLKEKIVVRDNARFSTLGDDTVAAVNNRLRALGWTQEHLVETAASFGLTLTTANKDKDFRFKNYTECEFLKRYFNYNPELKMNVAALAPSSYLQPFHLFVRPKDMTLNEYQAQLTEVALREALYGGRKSFETLKQRFENYYSACDGLAHPDCLFWTYEGKVAEITEFSKPQPPLFIVAETGQRLIDEYDGLEETALECERRVQIAAEKAEAEYDNEFGLIPTGRVPVTYQDPRTPSLAVLENASQWSGLEELRFVAESGDTEQVVLQTLEGEVQDDTGYINVNASASRMPIEKNTNPHDFLYRRQLIKEIAIIGSLDQPDVFCPEMLMVGQPTFQSRASHIAFRATGIKLTFVSTCPGTVTGCLIAAIVYGHDRDPPADYSTQHGRALLSMKPHILMRHGEESTVWHMEVPFISPLHAYHAFDVTTEDKTSVAIATLVPLTTSVVTGPTVTLRVYAEFVGLTLFGATALTSPGFVAESGEPEPYPIGEDLLGLNNLVVVPPDFDTPFRKLMNTHPAEDHSAVFALYYSAWRTFEEENPHLVSLPKRHHDLVSRCPSPNDDGFCYLHGFHWRNRPKAAAYLGKYPRGIEIMTCPITIAEITSKAPLRPVSFSVVICDCSVNSDIPTENDWEAATTLHVYPPGEDVSFIYAIGKTFPRACVGGEKLSTKILKVSNIVEQVADLSPALSMLNTPSEVIGMVGNGLQKFGFSKPISGSQARPSATFGNAAGADYADVLAVDPLNEVSPGLPTSSQDEMSFSFFSRRWTMVDMFEISPSTPHNAELYTLNVTPQVIADSRPASCAAPGLFHEFWRGSMEYKMELFCPLLVSVRLGIFYDPLGRQHPDLNDEPPVPQEDFQEHLILDSSAKQTAEIVVGYSSNYPALKTFHGEWVLPADFSLQWKSGNLYKEGYHNGHVTIRLIDYVNGGAASPMNIRVTLWTRAGSDMQWGRYTGKLPAVYVTPLEVELVAETPRCMPEPTLMTNVCVPQQTQPPTAETGGPSTIAPSTVAPTTIAPGTSVPTTMAPGTSVPTTMAPGSVAPTTASPGTSVPTTVAPTPVPTTAPTTVVPTTIPPTAPPTTVTPTPAPTPGQCDAGIVNPSWHNRGEYITPGTNLATGFDTNQPYTVEFNGSQGSANPWYIRVGTFCGKAGFYYRLRKTNTAPFMMMDGTTSVDLLALAQASAQSGLFPDAWEGYYVSTRTPAAIQPEILSFSVTSAQTGIMAVAEGVAFSAPVGYQWSDWTPHINGQASTWAFPGANGTPCSIVTIGSTIGTYCPLEHHLRFDEVLSWQGYSSIARVLIQVVFKGTLTIPQISWSASKASAQEVLLVVPKQFSFIQPTGQDAAGGNQIIRISIFSPIPQGYADSYGMGWPPHNRRKLGFLRTIASNFTAESGEIVDEANADEHNVYHLGGPLDHSEFFVRELMGEQVLSFRELLKIPFQTNVFLPTDSGFNWKSGGVMFPGTFEDDGLMFFLMGCFTAWRGGIMYHYLLHGNGSIEVSRNSTHNQLTFVKDPRMGISFTDSRINPKLSVKFPWQEDRMFFYSGKRDMSVTREIMIHKHDSGDLSIKEFRSTAEDFSFHYFRGLPKLELAP